MSANMEKYLWKHGVKLMLEGGWGPGFDEMPPCDFRRVEKCTLTSDLCNWPRCPYTPKYNITAKLKQEDGKIVERILYTDGSISTSYVGDAARTPSPILIEISSFRQNSNLEYVSNCHDCGRPMTMDEAMNSQGNDCKWCWDYTLYGPEGPKTEAKTRGRAE